MSSLSCSPSFQWFTRKICWLSTVVQEDVGWGQYSIHVWLIHQSWHIYLSSLHSVNDLHNKVSIIKVYTWMPQSRIPDFRKMPFLSQVVLIMWFEGDILPINLAKLMWVWHRHRGRWWLRWLWCGWRSMNLWLLARLAGCGYHKYIYSFGCQPEPMKNSCSPIIILVLGRCGNSVVVDDGIFWCELWWKDVSTSALAPHVSVS